MDGKFAITGEVLEKRANEFNGKVYHNATLGIIGQSLPIDLDVDQYHGLPPAGTVRITGSIVNRNGKLKLKAGQIELPKAA